MNGRVILYNRNDKIYWLAVLNDGRYAAGRADNALEAEKQALEFGGENLTPGDVVWARVD